LAAVFFDLDGTLIESEEVWNDAVRHLATSRGTIAGDALLAGTHGLEHMQAMRHLHEAFGWPMEQLKAHATWVERKVADSFRAGIAWRPGAHALLSRLRLAGIPTALVTSTYRHLVEIVLDALGRANFDAVVCGDEVRSPKPDPEPYLTAARLLDVDVRACVAIEDSPTGAASARAAGCVVLYVCGLAGVPGHDPGSAPAADATRSTLSGVSPDTLTELLSSVDTRRRPDPGRAHR
jgi:HAD superfamily hydrolase (TIGR01509 family)